MSAVRRTYGEAAAEREVPPRVRRRAAVASGAHRIITVLAVVGSIHAMVLLGVEAWRYVVDRQAVASLAGQVQDLQDEAKGLKQVVAHANDQRYREDLARRQGFMYPSEQRAVTQPLPAPSTGSGSGH